MSDDMTDECDDCHQDMGGSGWMVSTGEEMDLDGLGVLPVVKMVCDRCHDGGLTKTPDRETISPPSR